jgi:hypothetical protein
MTEPHVAAARCFLDRAASYAKVMPFSERLIRVGPIAVCIQVPATGMLAERFLSAFSSESEPDAVPECTIRVFDDADGRTTDVFPFDEQIFGVTGKCILPGQVPLKLAVNPVIGSISVVDWERREIAVWVRSFQDLPYWYVATPLRDEIAEVADRLGMDFIHAAGLGRGRLGICLVGRSGSGKSTTVLRGIVKGLQTVGDDFLLTDGRHIFGVYGRAKAHREAQQFVGDFSGAIVAGDREAKLILDLACLGSGDAFVPEMEIAAICVPRRDAGQGLAPARRMDVVRELLIHTSIGLREVYPASLRRMHALVVSVPCWTWSLGRDGGWLEESIESLLDAHG